MKKIFVLMFVALSLYAQMLNIDGFSTDVFSKISKKPVSIKLDLMVEGRYVEDESFKIIDALNIVIGSFYLEDLMTSKGKEMLKNAIKSYTSSKYSIDIDNIYMQKLQSLPNTQEIIDALKKEGMCVK